MSIPPGEDRISLSESEEDSFHQRKSAPLENRRFSREQTDRRREHEQQEETGRRREQEPAPPGTEEPVPQEEEEETNRDKKRGSREERVSGEKRRSSREERVNGDKKKVGGEKRRSSREEKVVGEKRRRSRSRRRGDKKEEEDICPPGETPVKVKTEAKSKESRPKSQSRQRSRRSKSRERPGRSKSREKSRRSRDQTRRSRSRDRSRRSRSRDRHRRSPPVNVNNGTWRRESVYDRTRRQEERKHQDWKKKSEDFLAKLGIPSTSIAARPARPPQNLYGPDLNSILQNIGLGVGGSEQPSHPQPVEFGLPLPARHSMSPRNGQCPSPPSNRSPPTGRFSPRRQFSPPPFDRHFSAPSETFSSSRQFSPLHRQFSSPPRRTSPHPFSSRDFSPPPRQFSAPRQYSPLRNRSLSPPRFSNSPPPSQFAQLFSSIGGYNTVSAPPPPSISTQDLDFRRNPPTMCPPPLQNFPTIPNQDPDTLRHGNYLVASWDILTVGGGLSSSIYQIGCFLPHGLSFVQCVLPEEGIEEAKENPQTPLLMSSGAYYVQHPVNKQLMPCCSEKVALTKFLMFLERGRTSTRPAYDGVVLVSHILESIPLLLKVVKKHKMEEAFYKTAKGFGDLCTFMAQNHSRRFIDEDRPTSQMNLSLNVVYKVIFGRTINLSSLTCDGKAQASFEILVKLLDEPPNYQNFAKSYAHPPQSSMMTKLASYRTIRERMELFKPLERFISQELAEQQVELLVTGMYAPSAEEEEKHLTEPQQVAVAMCRMLVASGFDFDRLLTLVKERGVADLELTLRTVFLGKMAGQIRAVVDQTIRTTRLVVAFFTSNGHKSLEQLQDEGREDDFLGSFELVNDRFQQDRFKVLYKEYKIAKDYFGRRLIKIMNSPDAAKVSSEMMINCLLQAGLHYDKLETMYVEDKKVNVNRNRFRHQLTEAIGNNFAVHGPPDVSLSQLIELLIDFFGSQSQWMGERGAVAKAAATSESDVSLDASLQKKMGAPDWYECTICKTKGHWSVDCSLGNVGSQSEEGNMEEKIKMLEKSIKTTYHTASTRADFLSRMNSLVAVKRFVIQKIQSEALLCGGSEKQVYLVAESVQKLMALSKFSHYSLKMEYDQSENNLAGKLFAALREKLELLPHGINLETLVEFIISYFKQYFPFRSVGEGTTSGGKMAPGYRNATSR